MNGEIDFEPALRERVALLRGLDVAVADRINENRLTLASGARTLVATMRAPAPDDAVSGCFDVLPPHRRDAGLSRARAIAARLRGPAHRRGRRADRPAAKPRRSSRSQPGSASAGRCDRGRRRRQRHRICAAGTGVAIHARPAVAAQAKVRIDHGDLTALLYLQGYRRQDFSA